jgi:hypothetical protein
VNVPKRWPVSGGTCFRRELELVHRRSYNEVEFHDCCYTNVEVLPEAVVIL